MSNNIMIKENCILIDNSWIYEKTLKTFSLKSFIAYYRLYDRLKILHYMLLFKIKDCYNINWISIITHVNQKDML